MPSICEVRIVESQRQLPKGVRLRPGEAATIFTATPEEKRPGSGVLVGDQDKLVPRRPSSWDPNFMVD